MAAEQLLDRTRTQQLEFVKNIWPSITDNAFQPADYTRLFRFIDNELTITKDYPTRYSKHSVDEIAEYILFLRQNLTLSKAQAIAKNRSPRPIDDDVLSRILDLAASMWLTTRLHTEMASECVTWALSDTLPGYIQSRFSSVPAVDDTKHDVIPRAFTAVHLCRNYGFTVNWTDDLCHHLSVDWENRRITIYEHLIYLSNCLDYPAATPIPVDVLEEAVDTINLLFPSDQTRTKKFLRDEHKIFNRLGYCGRERRLRLSDYRHWRQRINVLKQALDHPPKGYRQLVLDKDQLNFLNWATFWIAFVVALLTIISIAFGIAGTVISVKSYQVSLDSIGVSIQQLEIAIAMACADEKTAARLPQYCSLT